MNLTKSHKQAFVRAVMNDVPRTDYAQQLRDKIEAIIVRNLPKEIQEIRKNGKLVHHLEGKTIYALGVNFYLRGTVESYGEPSLMQFATESEWSELVEWSRLMKEQDRNRTVLERDLTGSVEGVRTLKQLQNLFPEMVKYMPSQIERTNNLPATNVVSALVQAGWPKGGEQNKTETVE